MTRLTILGGGSWGTALAIALASRFEEIVLWTHAPELAAEINATRENKRFLPGFRVPEQLTAGAAVGEPDLVLGVMPSRYARSVYHSLTLPAGVPIVSATKGLDPGTWCRMSEVIAETQPGHPIAALSGPTFAREIARGEPAAVVIAASDLNLAQRLQSQMATPRFRLYTNPDLIGVELGGALKNVVAIAAGIVQGLGLGNNTVAALITRGLAEMTRIATAAGADPRTLAGLTGLGDLVLTCTGDLSRNRRVGRELASGRPLAAILGGMEMVAEGVETAQAAVALAERLGVEAPICVQLWRILKGQQQPSEAIRDLMERSLRGE